ncbi:uncharacterized protein LOC126315264 isoform X2 [Schistocerca gregaria]|uniref:uncharacterized protein LOC126315264 isoform X2 n=1 Tax=Schistocerca gregaria TaxID=7010 RepID=UPI00211DA80D|nr:uncharacterized protein LOC126315264 isoform X2 [Schistocerca gregaria]
MACAFLYYVQNIRYLEGVYLINNLSRVGCFFSSTSNQALAEYKACYDTLTLLFYQPLDRGSMSSELSDMRFLYKNNQISFEFAEGTEMGRLLIESHVIFYTEIFPSITCINKEYDQRWTDELERNVNRWMDDNLNLSSCFLVKNSKWARVISQETKQTTLEMLIRKACSNSSKSVNKKAAVKSNGKKTIFDVQKGIPPVIWLELMQDRSHKKEVLSFRYEELLIKNKSADTENRQNTNIYMVLMNSSVLTYVLKTDKCSLSSLQNAVDTHIKNLRLSLSIQLKLLAQDDNGRWNARFYRSCHVAPDFLNRAGYPDLVTLLYPSSNVQKTEQLRNKYKTALGLDPVLKTLEQCHEIVFTGSSFKTFLVMCAEANLSKEQGHLCDIHLLLNLPNKDFDLFLVKGSYEYYHYMQDRISDSGWGCAYRSMQTLVSWITKQNLSIKPVPTHAEIQRMLVQMGDKPPSFVGSNKWIGAVEVSMCLSTHWNTTCKILHASSGKEVGKYTEEISNHFRMRGSPIMIGGGVLAYTLLGIAVNRVNAQNHSEKADVLYLILDPHYIGAEDPENIILKGYCRWKTGKIWQDKHFYNICLPLTPVNSEML